PPTPPDPAPPPSPAQPAAPVVVAPAPASLLAKAAAGIADDLLTATLLATRAPLLLAPAMHTEMWEHPAVRTNVATLTARGVTLVGPDEGHLAGGDTGPGRLAEPRAIVAAAARVLADHGDLAGASILVTAGGTREPARRGRFPGHRAPGKGGPRGPPRRAPRRRPRPPRPARRPPRRARRRGGRRHHRRGDGRRGARPLRRRRRGRHGG